MKPVTYIVYLDGMRLAELSDTYLRYRGEASDMVRSLRKVLRTNAIIRPHKDRRIVSVNLFTNNFHESHRRKKWERPEQNYVRFRPQALVA